MLTIFTSLVHHHNIGLHSAYGCIFLNRRRIRILQSRGLSADAIAADLMRRPRLRHWRSYSRRKRLVLRSLPV